MKKDKKFDSYKLYFLLQAFFVLLSGLALAFWFGRVVYINDTESLIRRVSNIAQTLDAGVVENLKGNSTDLANPSYEYLKNKLTKLRSVNGDSRFVYLMGYRRDINKLFFFVDSESPENTDSYSPPGEVYNETSDLEVTNFLKGAAFAEGPYKDAWGRWVSAYAPIYSSVDNTPIAIVGIDVDASKIIKDISYVAGAPLIIALGLIFLLYFFHRMKIKEKNAELGNIKLEFTSFMSHEIRAFVTKMKGGLRSLVKEEFGILTQDQSTYINSLISESDAFGDLVEEFLDIGKIEQDSEVVLKKSDYNLVDIIKSVVGDLKESLEKRDILVVYEGNIPEKVFSVCDNNKITRVFSNLLQNAVKYSSEKSAIHIGYLDSNNFHTMYIKDSGIGIPEADKDNIFKKFFRATNAIDTHFSGTGLGLYFSKLIIDRHQGKIWFESTPNRGTTFFVSLPKSEVR